MIYFDDAFDDLFWWCITSFYYNKIKFLTMSNIQFLIFVHINLNTSIDDIQLDCFKVYLKKQLISINCEFVQGW